MHRTLPAVSSTRSNLIDSCPDASTALAVTVVRIIDPKNSRAVLAARLRGLSHITSSGFAGVIPDSAEASHARIAPVFLGGGRQRTKTLMLVLPMSTFV